MAIGDSFTEGMNDLLPDGALRGWADRLAQRLAPAAPPQTPLRYANLAVRGKVLDQIAAEQIPQVLEHRPDLVGFSGGGNDLMRPGTDPDELAGRFEAAVDAMLGAGAQVLVFTGADSRGVPVLQRTRGKVAVFNEHLRVLAARRAGRVIVVDLWALAALRDARAWSADRIHLSPEGHERVALLAARTLGLPVERDADEPWPAQAAPTRSQRRRENVAWAREYLGPWVGRRVRRRSSGDGMTGKRPDLRAWEPADEPTA